MTASTKLRGGILVVDPTSGRVEDRDLWKFVGKFAEKEDVRSDIPYVFLLKTQTPFSEIRDEFKREFPDTRFLIMKIDPSEYAGFLPRRAWDQLGDWKAEARS